MLRYIVKSCYIDNLEFVEKVMLAKNKSGWKLMEYIDIQEDEIEQYQNVTEHMQF